MADNDRQFVERWESAKPILAQYLRKMGARFDDVEDILQISFTKIWPRRETLDTQNHARWLSYLKRVVDSARSDAYDQSGREEPTEEELLHVVDHSFTDAIQQRLEQHAIRQAADDLWLGEPPEQVEDKVLIASLLLVDGRRASDIARIPEFRERRVHVRAALISPRVWLQTTFHALAPPTENISAAVLGISANDLATAAQGNSLVSATGEWTTDEIQVTLRHCSHLEAMSLISRSLSDDFVKKIPLLTVRIHQNLPFILTVNSIRNNMTRYRLDPACLAEIGLWKRLVFHYSYDGLGHQDILSWFGGAAEHCGFQLGPMQVHGWISNKRLLQELRAQVSISEVKAWPC